MFGLPGASLPRMYRSACPGTSGYAGTAVPFALPLGMPFTAGEKQLEGQASGPPRDG